MQFRITRGPVFEEQEIVTLTTLASMVEGLREKWDTVLVSFAPDAQPHSYTGYITCSGAK